jgi:hypothetical protein
VLSDDPGNLARELPRCGIADEGMMPIESRAAAAPASAAILALLHEMDAVPSNYLDDDMRVRIMPTGDPDSKDFSRYSPNKPIWNQLVCFTTAFKM